MFRKRTTILSGLAVLAIAACGDDGTGPDPDPNGQGAAIDGSIENTTESAAPSASAALSAGPAGSAASASSAAAQASTVAAAAVSGDGSLDVLAEAEVQANGRFTIEDVPAGRTDLVISARDESGAEVGRVLVHGETETGATITTEPVTAETTVEGLVYSRLVAEGASDEVRSTATLALLIRMDEAAAADVAASTSAVADVAAGYRAGAEALAESFAEAGVDASARADAMLEAAVQHAESRDGGVGVEGAHEAFVEASVDAFAEAGADHEDATVATSVAATGLARAMVVADESARLDLARNAVLLNLEARERLAAEQPSSDEQSATASALADARVQVNASASLSELATAVLDAEESAEDEIVTLIVGRLPPTVPAEVQAQIEAQLSTAFAEADLSARFEGLLDVGAIVQAVLDYRQEVRSEVDAVVALLPPDVELDAEATASLLIAARGGPAIGS